MSIALSTTILVPIVLESLERLHAHKVVDGDKAVNFTYSLVCDWLDCGVLAQILGKYRFYVNG